MRPILALHEFIDTARAFVGGKAPAPATIGKDCIRIRCATGVPEAVKMIRYGNSVAADGFFDIVPAGK